MSGEYMRDVLRIAVAQICQTIGYNIIQTTPLELLQDTLYKFLQEFSKNLRRQVEHYNGIDAHLIDVYRTLKNLNVNFQEILDYINNVQPVYLTEDLPKFPGGKKSNFSFLKPGSREVLSRPVHIYEYLPPILQPDSSNTLPDRKSSLSKTVLVSLSRDAPLNVGHLSTGSEALSLSANGPKELCDDNERVLSSDLGKFSLKTSINLSHLLDKEGRPTREICSVVMTTGGFISPAIEGKLPHAMMPSYFGNLFDLDAPITSPDCNAESVAINRVQNNPISGSIDSNDIFNWFSSQPSKIAPNARTFKSSEEDIESNIVLTYMAKSGNLKRGNMELDIIEASKTSLISQTRSQKPKNVPKLLKKGKKKNTLNLKLNLVNFASQDSKVPENDLIEIKISEKCQRKNKKKIQKFSSSVTNISDFSKEFYTDAYQQVKIKKVLKKKSNEYTFSHEDYCKEELQNPDLPLGTANINEHKAFVVEPVNNGIQTSKTSLKDVLTRPQTQEIVPACLPILSPNGTSTLQNFNLSNSSLNITDNIDNGAFYDSKQMGDHSQENRSFAGVKLSTEFDRNKLNIFKKISKQKPHKMLSPTYNVSTSHADGSQYFNLPSGTTITPTPSSLNRLTSCRANLVNEIEENKSDVIFPEGLPETLLKNPNFKTEEIKPKKRGRRPGSKNLVKGPMKSPNNNSELTSLKKNKRPKSFNCAYPLLTFESTKSITSELPNIPSSTPREDMGGVKSLSQVKHNRKERKKNKAKNQTLVMSIKEEHIRKGDVSLPTKEDVTTINKKLMRMDTILQPLATSIEAPIQADRDIANQAAMNHLFPNISSNGKDVSYSQFPLQQQPSISLMPGWPPKIFMSKVGPEGFPNLMKFYPFPPRPGLIPHTAQNLQFPRLPPTFNLPIPNFKQRSSGKTVGLESSTNGTTTASLSKESKEEKSYCNVPPFIPESMQILPFKIKDNTTKAETKDIHKICTSITSTPEYVPPIIHKGFKKNDIDESKVSQLAQCGNILLPKADSHIKNKDVPIELSDDSVDSANAKFNKCGLHISKRLRKSLLKLPSTAASSQSTDKILVLTDIESDINNSEFDLNLMDLKQNKKNSKLVTNTKSVFPTRNPDSVQIDLFSTDKGVGKLAGGADLIPLTTTGSAYSAITIPPTSLTGTTASSMTILKKDFGISTTLKNSLMPTNFKDSGAFSVDTQERKREHKKLKKLKDIKIKKKKDRKAKNRERIDRSKKLLYKNDKLHKTKLKATLQNDADILVQKNAIKNLKIAKRKRCKQLLSQVTWNEDIHHSIKLSSASNAEMLDAVLAMEKNFPRITSESCKRPFTSNLALFELDTPQNHSSDPLDIAQNELIRKRGPSPELARILPLVTRPPKQKFSIAIDSLKSSFDLHHRTETTSGVSIIKSHFSESNANADILHNNPSVHSIIPPPSPWSSGGTIAASSVLLPQQLLQYTNPQERLEVGSKTDADTITNEIDVTAHSLSFNDRQTPVPILSEGSRPSSYIDAEGNRVWICPACGKVDDGSPMIGCDGCDAWYHWICVGICVAPKDNEDWFCRVCIIRKKGIHTPDKKRRRNKKK